MPDCGVVQGGKLSCLLYTIYTNEVPALHKIMNDDDLMMELTGRVNNIKTGVEHNTYNCMDDSNNCIIFKEANNIQEYIDNFLEVLKEYHNLSRLRLNEDKTVLLITSKPKHHEKFKDVIISDEDKNITVKQCSQIKILGFLTNKRSSGDAQINKIVRETSYVLNSALKNKQYLTEKARSALVRSQILGKIQYNICVIAGETKQNKSKIYKLLHKSARFIKGDYCYMQSIRKIMKDIKFKMPEEIISEGSANYICIA